MKIAVITSLALLIPAFARAQNLIQNPSFETPVRASSYTFMGVGDDMGGVWFVTETINDVGHVRGHPNFAALNPYPDGSQMVYVGDSGRAAAIAQPISTALVAGDYQFSFYLGTTSGDRTANARVELAPITGGTGASTTYGAPVFGQNFPAPGETIFQSWKLQQATIPVPSAGLYGLIIRGLDEPFVDNQTNVDQISLVAPVPEPATVVLLAVGGLIMLPVRRQLRSA